MIKDEYIIWYYPQRLANVIIHVKLSDLQLNTCPKLKIDSEHTRAPIKPIHLVHGGQV